MEGIKLEDLSVKELQVEAVKLGISEDEVKTFTIKAPLIITINALKKSKEIKPVDTLMPPVDPKEEKQDIKRWQSKADKMRDSLESQPKVRVLIPLDPSEKQGIVKKVIVRGKEETIYVSGAIWSKTFNGYKVIIPKGIYTEVPQQIADNIGDEYNQTIHAGDQWALDRIDPKTGQPVKNQLE